MFRNKYFVGAIHPPLKTGGFLAKSLRMYFALSTIGNHKGDSKEKLAEPLFFAYLLYTIRHPIKTIGLARLEKMLGE